MRTNLIAVAAIVGVVAPAAAQVYVPIPVTGYTQDVIADAGETPSVTTTAAFDQGFEPFNNNVLFEQGYNSGGSSNGLPPNGTIVTSANRIYQLGPINGNNSLRITQSNPTGTISLVTPARDAALSLLLAAGNGGGSNTLTVNWSNGQASTYPYTAYDWGVPGTLGPNSGTAIGGLDRADRSTGQNSVFNGELLSLFYYDVDLTADANYQAGAFVNSISFAWPGNSNVPFLTLNVMGLSGATAVPEPSALLLTAAAGLAGFLVRRRKAAYCTFLKKV